MVKHYFLTMHQATLVTLRKCIHFELLRVHLGICQGDSLSCVCAWLSHGLHPFPPLLLWRSVMSSEAVEVGGGLASVTARPGRAGRRAPRCEFTVPGLWPHWVSCDVSHVKFRVLSLVTAAGTISGALSSLFRRGFCETVLFRFYLLF